MSLARPTSRAKAKEFASNALVFTFDVEDVLVDENPSVGPGVVLLGTTSLCFSPSAASSDSGFVVEYVNISVHAISQEKSSIYCQLQDPSGDGSASISFVLNSNNQSTLQTVFDHLSHLMSQCVPDEQPDFGVEGANGAVLDFGSLGEGFTPEDLLTSTEEMTPEQQDMLAKWENLFVEPPLSENEDGRYDDA